MADMDTLLTMQRLMTNLLTDRSSLARRLGLQYNGSRDVYDAAGYDKTITTGMYLGRYERQDIAARIIEAPADATWRLAPEIRDGATWEEATDDTDFVATWQNLSTGGTLTEDGDTTRGILHYLHEVDRLAGIGRYGVLHLGIRDGGLDLTQPLTPGVAKGPDDLLYLVALAENDASIQTFGTDPSNRRYGRPTRYQLATWGPNAASVLRQVDWTRVIHVAEKTAADEIYGTPRLRAVWNRLMDLEKVLPGAAEAAWKLLDAGRVISTKDGYELSNDSAVLDAQKTEIEDFMNNLRRWLLMEGIEVTELGGQVTDPSGLARIIVAFIAAATSIPQRLLFGSERGELSSTQDDENWVDFIAARQVQHAEPVILRPTINRLVWAGVLPPPASGRYVVRWPALRETKQTEQAQTADAAASALQKMQIEVEPAAFVRAFLPVLSETDVRTRQAVTVVTPPPTNGAGADDTEDTDEEDGGQAAPGEEVAANAAPFRFVGTSGNPWARYP
jgi:hypothetical protein